MRFPGAPVCLAIVAAIATLSACGDSNEPSGSWQELVYYESFASDSNRIIRVAADGSNRTVLWEGRFLGDLHVSPDGAILFGADGWHLIPAAGGPAVPFTVPDAPALDLPRWSPDGQWILWRTSLPGHYAQGVAAAGSATLKLITPDSIEAFWTDWSPDAERVVFSGNNILRNTFNLYTVARDGSDLRKITPDSLYVATPPSWSHDGSRIAYPRNYIYTIAPDGSDLRQVTDGAGTFANSKVWWSPDDRQMMTGPGALWRVIVSTGAATFVGRESTGGDPWSPDGSRILYLLRTEPDSTGTTWPAVGVANIRGTDNVQVSANGIGSYEPAWLPGSN